MGIGRKPRRIGHIKADHRGGGGGIAFAPLPAHDHRASDGKHILAGVAGLVGVDVKPQVRQRNLQPEIRGLGNFRQGGARGIHAKGGIAENAGDHGGVKGGGVGVFVNRQVQERQHGHVVSQANLPALLQRMFNNTQKPHPAQRKTVGIGRASQGGKPGLGGGKAFGADFSGNGLAKTELRQHQQRQGKQGGDTHDGPFLIASGNGARGFLLGPSLLACPQECNRAKGQGFPTLQRLQPPRLPGCHTKHLPARQGVRLKRGVKSRFLAKV